MRRDVARAGRRAEVPLPGRRDPATRALRRRAALLVGVALVTATLVAASPTPLRAQEDFRQSEADRPLKVEDAYALKLREWETEAGLRAAAAEGGGALAATLELKAGLFRNGQAGVEMDLALDGEGPGSAVGWTPGAHLLYNLARETWSVPAVSARVDLLAPGAGDAAREEWAAVWKGIATRSFGRLRLHANGGYGVAAAADGGDHWLAGLGFDYPIGLFSRAILGDLFVEVPADAGRTRVWLEAGSRWQLTNRSVLDLGLGTRLDEWEAGRANVELTLGISRVFGVPGLTPRPAYPDPALR